MRDGKNQVIYVGKAKSLRSRVCSYFNNSERSVKVEAMASKVDDFDFVVTSSEAEAYVLENNLIKKHTPKYNIRLRDDKSYPYVLIDGNDEFPRIEYVRRPKKREGVFIFGPFPTGLQIGQVIQALTKSLQLRDCSASEFNNRQRPCLLYQIHQCSAPCVGIMGKENYRERLNLALDFFRNRKQGTTHFLEQRMQKLAELEKFEEATIIRDQLPILYQYLEHTQQKHAELMDEDEDVDIIGIHEGTTEVDLVFYMIRRGILIGQKTFHYLNSEIQGQEEKGSELKEMIISIYSEGSEIIPKKIVIPVDKNDLEQLEDVFQIMYQGQRISCLSSIGKWQSASRLANEQAKEGQRVRLENEDSPYVGLNKLKELLSLKEMPGRLEMVDIAIFQGSSPTAGLVVSIEGQLDKTQYRHYHLQALPEGNNDFAMMKEFTQRRFKEQKGNDPDVLIVDGGKGQVSAVLEALRDLNISIPVVGLAKSKTEGHFTSAEIKSSDERLIIPGRANPYLLRQCPSLFKILVSLRDEAHRFSRRLHHHAEKEKLLHSWVNEVEGIGPKLRDDLRRKIQGSAENYKDLSIPELMRALRIKPGPAKSIFFYLRRRFS